MSTNNLLNQIEIGTDRDDRVWLLEANSQYYVKSFYVFLNSDGILSPHFSLWQIAVPLKVRFVMWLAIQIKLNTTDVFLYKGIHQSLLCSLCGDQNESSNNLFLKCQYTGFLWDEIRKELGINNFSDD